MGSKVFLALVHYPIINKHNEIVTTSITNLDIHDISRCAATYDLERYYIVHPQPAQQEMAEKLLSYWTEGYGAEYNPDRCRALQKIAIMDSIETAKKHIQDGWGGEIRTVVTDARKFANSISYFDLRQEILKGEADDHSRINYLLLFGTGYGLAGEVMAGADYVLEPIIGRGDYNHLSVRSAASIILDRLLGPAWFEKK